MTTKILRPVFEGYGTIKPTAIVLHWWQVPSWFAGINYFIKRAKSRNISIQFAVTKTGEVYQLTKDPAVLCRHARCANRSSIGIEIQGFGKSELNRQHQQFNAVVKLVKELCEQYDIQTDFKVEHEVDGVRFFGITSHKIVDSYCNQRRVFKKRDVHNEYLDRVIQQIK